MGGYAFALLGSGEFEPWSAAVDRWVLDRADGDGSVLILPTASAAEGDEVFDEWAAMGLAHFQEAGVAAEVLPLKTREEAGHAAFVSMLDGASAVYFSGGNPSYLTATLSETPFWEALTDRLATGLGYIGCSAGVACLGETAPDSAAQDIDAILGHEGFRLFPGSDFGPHWDALDSFVPGLRAMILGRMPQGRRFLGIDERTAVVGDGSEWTVIGSGGALLIRDGAERTFAAGESFAESFEMSI